MMSAASITASHPSGCESRARKPCACRPSCAPRARVGYSSPHTEMTTQLSRTDRYFRGLLRFFPEDFRDEFGTAFVDAYRDRARVAAERGGSGAVAFIYVRAFFDALRNG